MSCQHSPTLKETMITRRNSGEPIGSLDLPQPNQHTKVNLQESLEYADQQASIAQPFQQERNDLQRWLTQHSHTHLQILTQTNHKPNTFQLPSDYDLINIRITPNPLLNLISNQDPIHIKSLRKYLPNITPFTYICDAPALTL